MGKNEYRSNIYIQTYVVVGCIRTWAMRPIYCIFSLGEHDDQPVDLRAERDPSRFFLVAILKHVDSGGLELVCYFFGGIVPSQRTKESIFSEG